jgi:hypothetical protein
MKIGLGPDLDGQDDVLDFELHVGRATKRRARTFPPV